MYALAKLFFYLFLYCNIGILVFTKCTILFFFLTGYEQWENNEIIINRVELRKEDLL